MIKAAVIVWLITRNHGIEIQKGILPPMMPDALALRMR